MTEGSVLEPEDDNPITEAEIDAFVRGIEGMEAQYTIGNGYLSIPDHGVLIRLAAVDAIEESIEGYAVVTLKNSGSGVLIPISPSRLVTDLHALIMGN